MVDHLIYIHGRLEDDRDGWIWLGGLNDSLRLAGAEPIPKDTQGVRRISYLDLLERAQTGHAREVSKTSSSQAPDRATSKIDYHERLKELAQLAGQGSDDPTAVVVGSVAKWTRGADTVIRRALPDVDLYVNDPVTRSAVLERAQSQLPTSGTAVVLAHSLGTIVALDLLDHLPADLTIDLLVTMGSPASLSPIMRNLEGRLKDWPYGRIRGWVNVIDRSDPVTGGRGLSGQLPTIDVRVDNPGTLVAAHWVRSYTSQGAVGRILATSLESFDRQPAGTRDINESDRALVLAWWFARHLQDRTPDVEKRQRIDDALANYRADIIHERDEAGLQALPMDQFTIEDVRQSLEGLTQADRVATLIESTFLEPFGEFEIGAGEDVRREAARDLAWALELAEVFDEIWQIRQDAIDCHKKSKLPMVALGLIGVGVVALMPFAPAALGGLYGLHGAAAVTKGLAVLGGAKGMLGGMWMLGGTAIVGARATRRAIGDLAPAQLKEELIKAQTTVVVNHRLGYDDRYPAARAEFLKLRKQFQTALARHKRLDDKGASSPSSKALKEKVALMDSALDWLEVAIEGPRDETANN